MNKTNEPVHISQILPSVMRNIWGDTRQKDLEMDGTELATELPRLRRGALELIQTSRNDENRGLIGNIRAFDDQ